MFIMSLVIEKSAHSGFEHRNYENSIFAGAGTN